MLTQGVQNANDGLSQLQIIDGGMNNISQLLDRARTLATESATGTFTGDRTVLNNEFQSVLSEIDRQSQAIGLNQGGTFAKNLTVFIGGGQGPTAAAAITNGSVGLDLSSSTVDSQSLGLKGFTSGYQVASGKPDSGLYDLSNASTTSVSKILANTSATSTSFVISGAGFAAGAGGAITVTANLQNVGDTTTLVTAINAAIQGAEQAGTPQAAAFKAANIAATVHTGADGHQQLAFTSSNTAFEVTAGDVTANGLMGNLTGQTNPGDANATSPAPSALAADSAFVGGGTQQYSVAFTTMVHNATAGHQDVQYLTISANNAAGTPQTVKIKLDAGATTDLTSALAIAQINQQLQATDNPALQSIVASTDGLGANINFASNGTTPFTVSTGATVANGATDTNGLGNPNTIQSTAVVGVGNTADISTQAGAQAAVGALANSIAALGTAQAVVGKGENQFNYAINLAQSQLTNFSTAEASIRDADMAKEAANLTKAQILIQAGVAALAQANSAPQQVLSLLPHP